jgi:hypothetical protein
VAVPVIDPVRDATDPNYRHSIYYIHPGRVDLVARRGQELLLVEARGTSVPPGTAVKKVIRQIVKHIDLDREDRSYGILLPDDPAWLAVLSGDRSPALKIVTVFLVSREGDIRTRSSGPADEAGLQAAAEKEIPAADDADDHDALRVQTRIAHVLGALGAVLRTPVHRLALRLPARRVRATAPEAGGRTPTSGTSEVTAGPPGPPSRPAPSLAEPSSARVEEVEAVIAVAPELPRHPSEEVEAVIAVAPELPRHPFDSIQNAATELRRVAVSAGAGPLHPLPFNRYEPVDTDWWLSTVSDNPAFKHGKIVLTNGAAAAPGELFVGLGFEKGIGPTAAELFARTARGRRRLMDSTWAWKRALMPALRSGAFAESAAAAEAAAGVPLTVFVAAIYVPPSPDWDDGTDVRTKGFPSDAIRFEYSGGTLALIDHELAAGLLDAMAEVHSFQSMASMVDRIPKGDWAWCDFHHRASDGSLDHTRGPGMAGR